MIKKLFNNIKMKVFEKILGQIIDRFKAKNPKAYAYIVAFITFVHTFAIAAAMYAMGMEESFPELMGYLPSWIAEIPLFVSTWLWAITGALLALTGSHTPPGTGIASLILMKKTKELDGKVYESGRHYVVKNKIAADLIANGYAQIAAPTQFSES